MTARRDFAELIEVLSEHKHAYELLLSLSRCQREAFENDGPAGLMRIIARKQEAIDRLYAIDARLTPYTADWPATISALPDQARREVADITEEIGTVVKEIMTSEREIEVLVTAVKKATGKKIKTISEGKTVAKAYGTPALAGTGRYLDRES